MLEMPLWQSNKSLTQSRGQKLTPSTLQLNTNSVGQWKAEDSQNTIMF